VKLKLYCLPHAGSSAASYLKLKEYINPSIEVCPIELAGRGRRWGQRFYEDVDEAVNDIYNFLGSEIDGKQYAFLGHSIGAILAYETIQKLIENKRTVPIHSFFSGRNPPHISENSNIHMLPDNEIIKELKTLGGTSRELLEDDGLMKFFLPVIRADYRLSEKYKLKEKKNKLTCSISILNGNDDCQINDEVYKWKTYTDAKCFFYEFEGDHFFINKHQDKICKIINKTLLGY